MEKTGSIFRTSSHLLTGLIVLTGLYASSLYSYLLFHTLVELFSVVTAFVVFALAWNTRATHDNHYLLFIGIASLFTGALDLIHTLSYKDMGVFPDYGANLATQFWIAFRFVFSVSFFLAPFFIERKLHVGAAFALYAAAFSALTAAIFMGWFPDCYLEDTGLTRFKIVSEYVICLVFLASLFLLALKRSAFDSWVLRLMALSLICSIAAELSFTQYVSVYGSANMLGHLFLLASVALIYRALVVTGVVDPSRLLFRNLKQSEEAIRASEKKYRLLFENMINGFAYHRIVTNEKGEPVDYVFLEVNDAFERVTGLKREAIVGKRVREALPGIENDPADWIGVYGKVALTGSEAQFEMNSAILGKWYSVSAYSPIKGHFVTIFDDISERKLIEKELQHARDELELRVKERTAELARANEELEQEIGVRRLAERDLRKSEERFRTSVENLLDGFAIFSAVRDDAGRIVDFRYEYVNQAGCRLNRRTRDEQVGRRFLELPPYTNHDLFSEYVRVVETGEPIAKSNIYENRKEGGSSRAFDFQAVKLGDGFAVVWRDVSERRETERRMTLTNELLKLYTRKFSRKEYLDVTVELIREWSGCRHTGVRIADQDGNIPYESCAGYNPDFLSEERVLSVKDDQCVCTRVASGAPELPELGAMTPNGSFYCNEFLQLLSAMNEKQRARYRRACTRHGFTSLAVVPIRHRDRILGAIHIADERAGMAPLRKVEFIEQLAFIVGEALFRFGVEEDLVRQREELVRMNEQLRNLSAHVDAVREAERTSIAREIHDELGQILTAIKMDVSWLRNRLSITKNKLGEKAKETLQIIDAAIQSVKRISSELRPGVLDDIGLAEAIDWAAKDFQKRTGVRCAVSIRPETMSVDRMRSTAIFRIFQESLTNIIRHAQASQVDVSLEEKNRTIVLTVRDNGKGIKKEEISAPHAFGLIGMRERVKFLGGKLVIAGAHNQGTTVTVTLPIDSVKEVTQDDHSPGYRKK